MLCSAQPVRSSAPHSGQARALGGIAAPQFAQVSGARLRVMADGRRLRREVTPFHEAPHGHEEGGERNREDHAEQSLERRAPEENRHDDRESSADNKGFELLNRMTPLFCIRR